MTAEETVGPRPAMTAGAHMRVTVVVPTIGRPDTLAACVGAIRAGRLPPASLVVVDQSSAGPTQDAIRAICADVDATWLHRDEANAAAARNAGAALATTALVAFTDDDCVPSVEWLAALTAAYHRVGTHEPVAAVSGSIHSTPWAGGTVAVSSRGGALPGVFRRPHRGWARTADPGWAPWDAGSGGNMLVPADLFRRLGGFDVRLGPGTPARAAEDIDLLRRLASHGVLVYEPSAAVAHLARTRAARLRTRYPYGIGMGAMLAGPTALGGEGRELLARYVRHVGREAFRRGWWGPVETWLTLVGIGRGIVLALARR